MLFFVLLRTFDRPLVGPESALRVRTVAKGLLHRGPAAAQGDGLLVDRKLPASVSTTRKTPPVTRNGPSSNVEIVVLSSIFFTSYPDLGRAERTERLELVVRATTLPV